MLWPGTPGAGPGPRHIDWGPGGCARRSHRVVRSFTKRRSPAGPGPLPLRCHQPSPTLSGGGGSSGNGGGGRLHPLNSGVRRAHPTIRNDEHAYQMSSGLQIRPANRCRICSIRGGSGYLSRPGMLTVVVVVIVVFFDFTTVPAEWFRAFGRYGRRCV